MNMLVYLKFVNLYEFKSRDRMFYFLVTQDKLKFSGHLGQARQANHVIYQNSKYV